jgi:hypothetical protein
MPQNGIAGKYFLAWVRNRGICGDLSLKRTKPSFKKTLIESTTCLVARIKAGESQRNMSAKRLAVWAFASEVDRGGAFCCNQAADKPGQALPALVRSTPAAPGLVMCYASPLALTRACSFADLLRRPFKGFARPLLVHARSLAFAWLPLPRRLLRSGFFGLRLPHGSTTTLQCTGSKGVHALREHHVEKSLPAVDRDGAHTSIV